jgi:hypothetical protein
VHHHVSNLYRGGNSQQQQGVCHTMAFAIYIKKYLKAKEELWKFKYFTMQK